MNTPTKTPLLSSHDCALATRWGEPEGVLTSAECVELVTAVSAFLAEVATSHDSFEPVEEAQASGLMDALGSSESWVGELMDLALSGDNLKCDYSRGACVAMGRYSRRASEHVVKSGIVALDNRVNLQSFEKQHHMGFALKGATVTAAAGKGGILLNFCPWCGADFSEWRASFREAIEGEA